VVAEEPPAPPAPVQQERSQRARRPPRYLADYAVGHLELPPPPREGSPSSTDDYPILVENSLHYPGEISDRILEGTRLRELSFQNSMEFPIGRVTRTSAVMGRSPPAEQSKEHMEIKEVSQPDSPPPPAPVPAPSGNRTPLSPRRCVPPALVALSPNGSSSSSPPGRSRAYYTVTTLQAQIREKTQPTHPQLPVTGKVWHLHTASAS